MRERVFAAAWLLPAVALAAADCGLLPGGDFEWAAKGVKAGWRTSSQQGWLLAPGEGVGGSAAIGVEDAGTVGEYYRLLKDRHDGMLDCADLLRKNKELGREKKPHCDDMVFECVTLAEQILREKGKI